MVELDERVVGEFREIDVLDQVWTITVHNFVPLEVVFKSFKVRLWDFFSVVVFNFSF